MTNNQQKSGWENPNKVSPFLARWAEEVWAHLALGGIGKRWEKGQR